MESPLLEQLHRDLTKRETIARRNNSTEPPSYAGVKAISLTHKTFALWVDKSWYTKEDRFTYLGHIHNEGDLRFFFKIDKLEGNTPSEYKGTIKDSLRVLLCYGQKLKKSLEGFPFFGSHSQILSSVIAKDILIVTMGTLEPPIERSHNLRKKKLQEILSQPFPEGFEATPLATPQERNGQDQQPLEQLPEEPTEESLEGLHTKTQADYPPEELIPEEEEVSQNLLLMKDIYDILEARDRLMTLVDIHSENIDMEFDKNGFLKINFSF